MNETQEGITAKIVAQSATATAKAVSEAVIASAAVIAKEHQAVSTDIAVIQAEMSTLKKQMGSLEMALEKIFCKLEEISLGRPTWAVTIILGGLFSLCVGLIVFSVSHR